MSIESLVQPPLTRIVGTPWTLGRRLAANASLDFEIASVVAPVKRDHRYKITVTAAGYLPCEAAKVRKYEIVTAAEIVVSQRVGMDRGEWNGLMAVPIRLCGLWTATADNAAQSFSFRRIATAANVEDELAIAFHQMWVEEIGHA